jgi:hypothetical protein
MAILSCQLEESVSRIIPFNQLIQEAEKRMTQVNYSDSLSASRSLNFHHSFPIQADSTAEVESRIKYGSALGSLQFLVQSDCFDAIQPSLQSRRFQSNQSAQMVAAKEATWSPSDSGESGISSSQRLDNTFAALAQLVILIHRECGAQIPSTEAPHPRKLQADKAQQQKRQGNEFSRRYTVDRGILFASQTGNP